MPSEVTKLDEYRSQLGRELSFASGNEQASRLYGGSGGGPMDPSVTMKEYVDVKTEALESRLSSRLDSLSTKSTVWAALATGVGICLTVLAIAGDRFDGGISATSLLEKQRQEQAETDRSQDAKLESMNKKLDVLINRTAEKK